MSVKFVFIAPLEIQTVGGGALDARLAPHIYEGGAPKGRGEYTPVLDDSPSHGFRRDSPLINAGAKMRLRRLVTAR